MEPWRIRAISEKSPVVHEDAKTERGPESQHQPGVPQATVTKYEWTSKIYAGTVRV